MPNLRLRNFLTTPILLLTFSLNQVSGAQTNDWVSLFNGKNLEGWIQRGGKAEYKIENDTIVGVSVCDTGNSFLCTTSTYGDFILEYEFKVDSRLNSGVQIRSEYFDHPKVVQFDGKQIEVPPGRVHGYQIEIDPNISRGRLWSAGIYDEARRGWLFPKDGVDGPEGKAYSQQGERIFKPDDWNHVRVEAIGNSIKTWLNGAACADLQDGMTLKGFVALQVHTIRSEKDKEGAEVRWRNLRIKEVNSGSSNTVNELTEAERSAGWHLLWDGKTFEGWRGIKDEEFPNQCWDIDDGILTVHQSSDGAAPGGGSIISRERYSNFELVADFKVTPIANSGIKYFVQSSSITGIAPNVGCEFQLLDDQLHPDAKMGQDGNRTLGSLYDLIPASVSKRVNPVGEWNTARIVVRGKHVEHWLNGEKTLEYERGSPAFRAAVVQSKFKNIPNFGEWRDGHILLQEHGDRVQFRNLKIRVLPAS